MDDLTERAVESLLNEVADRTPTPGGGSVTAVAGALSCALARMVAAYSVGKKTEPNVRARVETVAGRLHRTDQLLRALVTQDAAAYRNMTTAAKAAKENPSAQTAYSQAVLAALAVPMEIAAVSSNALYAMDEFKTIASTYLLSDLGVAAVLAEATVRAAKYTVHVNLRELDDAETRTRIATEIEDIVKNSRRRLESVEGFVHRHLESHAADSR